MKALRPVVVSNGVPFLQMRYVGSHSTSGREKEGIKERMGFNIDSAAITAISVYAGKLFAVM